MFGRGSTSRSAVALAVLSCLLASSCGHCLLVESREVVFEAPDGARYPGVIEVNEPHGLLDEDESPLRKAVVGLLIEPVDILLSTAIAVEAVFRSDRSIVLGPLGWLATLTPFATAMPQLHLFFSGVIELDDAQFEALRSGDDERALDAVRAAASEGDIVGARLTSTTPLPDGTRR
ncbi:MAG: hypothetical protein HZB39_18920 [Planctomycetes bacterium]|nr:hypothetical protein [Planctomycetota bacterium]